MLSLAMNEVSSERIWKTWRRRGFGVALASFLGAIGFGVIDHFTAQIIPSIAETIADWWTEPQFVILFTSPADIDEQKSSFVAIPLGDKRRIRITEVNRTYLSVSGPPGLYSVSLRGRNNRILPAQVKLKRGEEVKVDTADSKWEQVDTYDKLVEEIKPPPSQQSPPGGVLREVRWLVTSADLESTQRASTTSGKRVASIAIQEVGTDANGSAEEKARIYDYWNAIPLLRDRNKIKPDAFGPWGGAFLSWVVIKAGLRPPDLSAAYNSWPGWGTQIRTDAAEPGDIALFNTKEVPGLRGSFLAGFFLRRRADCTEIITGNVVDRVVIACVNLPMAYARRAVS